MHSLPQRKLLPGQTADILLKGIRDGVWREHLPGEHALCAQLQISRTTLRPALAKLAKEGWISASQGQRRRILRTGSDQRGVGQTVRRVVLLMSQSQSNGLHLFLVGNLREKLARAGFEMEVFSARALMSRRPEATLEKLVRERRDAVWVLSSSSAAVQSWFMARRLPCVLDGSRHPGITLPMVDLDYYALGQHAARQILHRGHRQVALLMPDPMRAGDQRTVDGFGEVCVPVGAALRVVKHDGTVAGITRKLDDLLRTVRPTVLLVAGAEHLLTVLTHLHLAGVRVPQQISVLCRDGEQYLAHLLPPLTRYTVDQAKFGQRLSRAVLTLARGGVPRDHLLLPDFIKGGTLARLSP